MIRRNIVIRVRLTQDEYEYLCRRAEKSRDTRCKNGARNLSAFIRKCILDGSGYSEKINRQKALKNLEYQIRKIGVNINQATKKINSGYYGADICKELQNSLEEINNRFDEIAEKVRGQNGSDEADEY